MSNRITHFEIPADNPERAMRFFEDAFGWSFDRYGTEDYWYAKTGKDKDEGINGAIMRRRHPDQPVTNSINVRKIDDAMMAVEKAGGQILVPKTPVPQMGWLSFFKDPDGNIHGLWQKDKKAK